MTPNPLPARPNLEQLKKQAKSLLRAAQDRDAGALRRLAALPAFSDKSPDQIASGAALHDAQSVIAREHGFESWASLREEVEARTLSFDAAVEEFVRCATGGASGRADRLLALHPAIASATLHTALVLGDAAAVEARLGDRPELATTSGGPQDWEPLLYVCHTCLHQSVLARVDGLVRIARALLALGANPNAEYHWNWHPELPRTALWASVCTAESLTLADVLLAAGANPTDGVTMHIAGGGGNLAALELLHRYGVNVNGVPGGVPPLVYMMQWSVNPAGPFWLLEHGADANLAWGNDAEAPLHVAARRWDLPMVARLVAHGADPRQPRADGSTPHTLAELHGNHDIAVWLLAHGAIDELSEIDRFIAACARADRTGRRGAARRPARARARAPPRTPSDVAETGRERQRGGARDDAGVRVRSERRRQGSRHGAAPRVDERIRRRRTRAVGRRRRRQRARRDVRRAPARLGRRGTHACA